MPPLVQDILLWCLLVLLYLGVATAAWRVGQRLLPPPPHRAVPWTALEILVLFIAVYWVWGSFFYQLLVGTGLGEWLYKHDVIAAAKSREGIERTRVGLLASALALPFQVWTVIAVLRLGSGTQPSQIGLTFCRAGRNVVLGILGWLILTPPVLGVNAVVTWLFSLTSSSGISDHPLTRLSREPSLAGTELVLVVVVAVVVAPVVEEIIFRGLLQPWLAQRSWGGYAAMGLALLAASPAAVSQVQQATGWVEWLLALSPVLFVLVMLPGCLWVSGRSASGGAIYGTSLLFAAVHSTWPSPVALFVLALGLGWLARRTQSLIGPMVLHGLFNAVACVELLLKRSGLA